MIIIKHLKVTPNSCQSHAKHIQYICLYDHCVHNIPILHVTYNLCRSCMCDMIWSMANVASLIMIKIVLVEHAVQMWHCRMSCWIALYTVHQFAVSKRGALHATNRQRLLQDEYNNRCGVQMVHTCIADHPTKPSRPTRHEVPWHW